MTMTSTTTTTRIDRVNILLVDDQPAKLLSYQTILSSLGETLIAVTSASEALECLLKNDIAVVLVDVCMPELDGYELAAMIRQHPRFQQTAIIFVSAVMVNDLDRLRGYECGAVDYVPVPVVPEILRAKVSVFADLYRKTRALERLNNDLEERVTERTSALEATTAALQDADRRKDEFLAMLAHELRNPLAPIRTAVQLLRLKELDPPQRARARDVIERQVEHLVTLIDDLLDVSRITRGMITLQREPVLVGAIVARAVETARPAIDAQRHELTLELADELITVDGDKTRLVQVLANILHNASKFTDPGGRIHLKVAREGAQVAISISDNGIGISPELMPKVFELFTQVHSKSERAQGGLGIGLALVRRLTEMHGGTVTVRSDGLGLGAEFTVRIPTLGAEKVGTTQASESPAIAVTEPRRILVVDDNLDAAESLMLRLQLAGHDVRAVHDGLQALETGKAFKPDIVLLDLGMPKMDGCEAARRIRRTSWGKSVTLIALTGWGQQQDRQRTFEAGFDVHLVKPVGEAQLFDALASAGEKTQGTDAAEGG
ncbi:MAG TPA: response regulator [Gemmatimonadaceae bacterium]|nr:response regulator [Gemmatimonadaceae bacterium]